MTADFDDEVTAALARYDVPGAALAVVKDGQVAYAKGFGVRSLEDSRPVTTDTLFLIGSLTNAMTSMMMGSMVDDGLLQWDTNVTDVLPGFALSTPDSTPQIRIRDMLNHVSSVGDGASVLTVVS